MRQPLAAIIAATLCASPPAAADPDLGTRLRGLERRTPDVRPLDRTTRGTVEGDLRRLGSEVRRSGPGSGFDRARLRRLERAIEDEGARERGPVLPGTPGRRTRLIGPRIPEADIDLDDIAPVPED